MRGDGARDAKVLALSTTLCLVALVATACRRAPLVVVRDLAADPGLPDYEAADQTQVILFGTPTGQPSQEYGFTRFGPREGGEAVAWTRREAGIALNWPETKPRSAVLDLAPFPGLKDQLVELRLNGAPLGRVELPQRRRLSLELPLAAQKPGGNLLALSFSSAAAPGATRRLAAGLFSLVIAAPEAALLQALAAPGALPVLSAPSRAGVPVLIQLAPSRLRFAFRLPPGAELRLTPALEPASLGAAHVAVRLKTPAGEQQLWTSTLAPGGDSSEKRLRLPGAAGELALLTLEATPVDVLRPAWVAWRAPRLLGTDDRDPLDRPPAPPETQRRAASLRASLGEVGVLLLVLDAAGARHFSCYGYPRATTPEIDRLAAEGVVFEQAFTPAVFTLGAMGALWTSLPAELANRNADSGRPLPRRPLTLAERLAAHGVASAGFVANGMAGPAVGLHRGFTEFEEVFRLHGLRASAFRNVLPDWFRRQRGRFFAYVHFREPHFPFDPQPPFDTRFGPAGPLPASARTEMAWIEDVNSRRIQPTPEQIADLVRLYDGNLATADHEVGFLRGELERAGLWDRVVVMLLADHGEALYEHGFIGHNEQLHEESVRVPLIVRFPRGAAPSGVRVRELVDLLDVAPTVAEILGVPATEAFRGQSLLPIVFGAPGRPFAFSRTGHQGRATYSVRDGRWAYIRDLRHGHEQLFDVTADPGESRDLSRRRGLETAYYRQILSRWLAGLRGDEDAEAPPAQLTPEQKENLKALGYVQ